MRNRIPSAWRGAAGVLFLALLAGWPLASSAQNTHTFADGPIPALIAFGGESGAGDREWALNEQGHVLLDAVRSDPLASDLRVQYQVGVPILQLSIILKKNAGIVGCSKHNHSLLQWTAY